MTLFRPIVEVIHQLVVTKMSDYELDVCMNISPIYCKAESYYYSCSVGSLTQCLCLPPVLISVFFFFFLIHYHGFHVKHEPLVNKM